MQKLKYILFKQPALTAAAICFVIATSIFIFSSTEETTVQAVATREQPTPSVTLSPSESEEVFGTQTQLRPTSSDALQDFDGQATVQQSTTQQSNSTHSVSSGQDVTNAPEPTKAPEKKTFTVSLSVNGSGVGNVTLEEGANQCDVLTKALEQGKISQLLIRYVSSLGTNGVYQINGIGKDNAVWWVYTVNGTSPTQGCSFVSAQSGDTVAWEYT
ncbi:MAG TPA: DUF4430 domain-containing protein, partial [Patescibacteria group bacterium]|nr:DUF4430 domain-containing protein [Patescibacteria group bacterium]